MIDRVYEEWLRFKAVLPRLMRDKKLRDRWVVFRNGEVHSDWPDQDSAFAEDARVFGARSGSVIDQVADVEPIRLRYA